MLWAFIISLTTQISINTPYPEQWANNNTNSFQVITYVRASLCCVLCDHNKKGKCINVSTYNLLIGGHIAICVEVIHFVQCPLFNILKTNENNGKKLTEELRSEKKNSVIHLRFHVPIQLAIGPLRMNIYNEKGADCFLLAEYAGIGIAIAIDIMYTYIYYY